MLLNKHLRKERRVSGVKFCQSQNSFTLIKCFDVIVVCIFVDFACLSLLCTTLQGFIGSNAHLTDGGAAG